MSLKPEILKQTFALVHDGQPIDMGDGLVLRFITPADVEPLSQFNGLVFSAGVFDPLTAAWSRDLCSPEHPTSGPSNVTIVEDTRASGKIVSTMCLIPQTWTYAGIPFGVGRIEAVGTDADYRRRGLIRAQFDVHHARSTAMGHLIQAITGIPWFYRQFGYEYAMDLGGGREMQFSIIPGLKEEQAEPYRLRPMQVDDIPFVMPLYEQMMRRSLVACPRPEWMWRYLMTNTTLDSFEHKFYHIIDNADGRPVGYIAPSREINGNKFAVYELEIVPGQSLREVMPSVLRWLQVFGPAEAEKQGKTVRSLYFTIGREHPVYDAVPEYWTAARKPYGWYIRVPDTAAFCKCITPVLESRLANSVMAGYSGSLKINEFKTMLQFEFGSGKLVDIKEEPVTAVTDWQPAFPPRTFLQMLFGYRSRAEIEAAFPDCFNYGDAQVLLDVLFPKQASALVPLG